VLRFWRQLESLDRSNAEDAEHIREVALYDYVSDDFSTNDMTESDEGYVEAREGTRRTQKTLRRRKMIAATTWTLLTTVSIRKASRYGVK
jgi:hypothetical protein